MSKFSIQSLEPRRFLSASPIIMHDVSPSPTTGIIVPVSAGTMPKPSQGGLSLTEVANQQFTAKLGEFTKKVTDLALNAVITWGDGTHSAGILVGSYATGEYYVKGTHTYPHAGTFQVVVKIFAHPIGSPIQPTSPVAQFASVITATPLKPTAGGVTLTEVAGKKFTAKVGEFTFKTIDEAINAVIDWGDGTKSPGTLLGSYATGEYYVQGTHTYGYTGIFKVDVKIFAHPIGSPIISTSPVAEFKSVATVMAPVLTPGGLALSEVANQQFTAKLGEFTYKTVDQALNAVIDWGDGSTSAGVLVGSYATGEYYVKGAHTYAHPGTFAVFVDIFGHLIGSPIHPTSPLAQFESSIHVTPGA